MYTKKNGVKLRFIMPFGALILLSAMTNLHTASEMGTVLTIFAAVAVATFLLVLLVKKMRRKPQTQAISRFQKLVS